MIITSAVEILELIADLRSEGKLDLTFNVNDVKSGRSISKLAKGTIMEYPVIASRSLSIEDLTMVSKALERQYTTYVRLAMSLDDELGEKEKKTEYINRFHANSGSGINATATVGKGLSLLKNESVELLSEKKNVRRQHTERKLYRREQEAHEKTKSMFDRASRANRLKDDQLRDRDLRIKELEKSNKELKDNALKMAGRYNTDPSKSPYKNQLIDNDVKKANELVPTTIDVAIRRKGYDGYDHLMLGIKTILHPVNSEEMIQNVATSLREKRNLFRFIQWTTGEIKFVKDYLLAVDRLRDEALSSRKDSKWWRALKTKSRIAKLRRLTATKDQLIPNCSLVLTMDEVEYLNNIYDLDILNNISAVKQLMDVYFLLGLVIVDPASEMAYFFFDGNNDYQTFTFASLERENSNPQRDMKNMLSLLGR